MATSTSTKKGSTRSKASGVSPSKSRASSTTAKKKRGVEEESSVVKTAESAKKPVARKKKSGAVESKKTVKVKDNVGIAEITNESVTSLSKKRDIKAIPKTEVKLESKVDKPEPKESNPESIKLTEASVLPKETVPEPSAVAQEAPAAKRVMMKPPILVKDLAAKMELKPYQVIHDLMEMNIFAALTQALEVDIARKVCEKRGFIFEVEKRDHEAGFHKPKEEPIAPPKIEKVKEIELAPRAPIITFMGHVDHGKTSLMDAIRQARVAQSEAGGITQHIGAYTVNWQDHPITFMDTPGHAAFSAMRARGANITDIVVLVVAADDGIMPQTEEAIAHAKAAKVKIMVAINKIDLPGADLNKVKMQLQDRGLQPEEWGGDTIVCEVSATKKQGLDRLLENMIALAEIMELKANPKGFAKGVVIEAQLEQGRGPTATVLVQTGALDVGDAFVVGDFWGKVKSMFDDRGQAVKSVGPAAPVKILGLTGVPNAGDALEEMKNEKEARALSEERLANKRLGKLESQRHVTLENLFETLAEAKKKVLHIVLKGDVQGSVEAVSTALTNIKSDKVSLDIIYQAVGPITESDVSLAAASEAVIIGFNTRVENTAVNAAKREGVQIKLYSIIYELIDQVQEALAGLLDPVTRESVIGTAIVKQVIELSKYPVAGCAVQSGRIARNGRARVLRNRQPVYDGGIMTLKRFQQDVSEVRNGLECGIRLGDFNEYHVGDVIECYQLEKVPQKL